MRHLASPSFWDAYRKLPEDVRILADKQYGLLKTDPRHPSLRFKKVGRFGAQYRCLAVEVDDGLLWFWIGSHADYDAIIR